jgi:tetratricopeptide (TPR) repeat protein
LGLSLKRIGKYEEAESIFRFQLIPRVSNEELPKVVVNLATVFIENHDYDSAITFLKDMLKKNPDVEMGWGNLGLSYICKKDYANAIESLSKAVRISGNEPRYQVQLGEAYLRNGNFEQAYSMFDSAWRQGHVSSTWLRFMTIAAFLTDRKEETEELIIKIRTEVPKPAGEKLLKEIQDEIGIILDDLRAQAGLADQATKKHVPRGNTTKQPVEPPQDSTITGGLQSEEPTGFSIPFINTRVYQPDNTFSIDYYGDTDDPARFAREFVQCYRQITRDPSWNFGAEPRATMLYFTQCPACKIEILTNRELKANLRCRKCDELFPTSAINDNHYNDLLEGCLKGIGIEVDRLTDAVILIVVQLSNQVEQHKITNEFLKEEYKTVAVDNNKLVFLAYTQAQQRGLFTRNEPLIAFEKEFNTPIITYEGKTPPVVEAFILRLRRDYPGLRSVSIPYNRKSANFQELIMSGRNEEALVQINKELEKDPQHISLLEIKIFILTELKRVKEAMEIAEDLLSLYPDNAKTWFQKGLLLDIMGQTDKAIYFLNQAVKIDPVDKGALTRLAICYNKMGNKVEFNRIRARLNEIGGAG